MKLSSKALLSLGTASAILFGIVLISGTALGQEREDSNEGKHHSMTVPVAELTPVQAMKIAGTKAGGKAVMATFEFDEGHWVYGVLVVKNHKLMEVELDPITGKVGDTESVDPAGEAKEFKHELEKLAKS